MKKILIIENEFASIKDSIDALMEMFQGLLHYDLVAVSQDIKWSEIEQYSAIFVDVSLSPRTELDGYGILNRIKERYPSILSRLAVVTGNHVIKDDMQEHGFANGEFSVFQKPLKYMELYTFINNQKNSQQHMSYCFLV